MGSIGRDLFNKVDSIEKDIKNSTEENISNPIPMVNDLIAGQIDLDLKVNDLYRKAKNEPLKEIDITQVKTMQKTIQPEKLRNMENAQNVEDYPIVIRAFNQDIVLDGNHRIINSIRKGERFMKVHYSNIIDLRNK